MKTTENMPTAKTTVRVTMEVEIDPAAWVAEYGTDPEKVVGDFEDYLLANTTNSPAAEARCFQVTAYAVGEA